MTGGHTGESFLFALDGNRLKWQRIVPYPEQDTAPIAIGPDGVNEAASDGVLYAFARDDGQPRWQYRIGGALGAPSVGADGTIYVTGPRHNLHAIAPDGTQKWVVETER